METLPKSFVKFIWHFIKKKWGYFLAIQLLAVAWSLDSTLWPYAFKLLIDQITIFSQDKSQIWYNLAPVLFFWGGLWLTIEVMFRIQGIIMAKTFPKFEAAIRMAMFSYVENHSYDYFANNFAGNISNKISDMTRSATRVMQLVLTLFVPALLALLIAIAMFLSVRPLFAVLLGSWVMIHIGICLAGAKRCSKLSEIHSSSRSYLTGKIVDTFTNIVNVKLFARKRFEYDYVSQYQQDEQKKQVKAYMAIEKIQIALGIASFIFPGVLLTWYMIYSWQHDLILLGDLVLIFNTTWNIMLITWLSGSELPNFFKEIGTCQQALSVIKAKHDIADHPSAKPLQVNQGEIVFNQVSFNYVQGSKVFKDIDVTIEPGTKVGLVGFSGSGKSTFVNLLMRFYEVDYGSITIDGTDVNTVTLESLRESIAMIPQDPSLFHRSLMENIRYGKLDATDEEVLVAAKQAHCHEFINQLPQRYDALVGERGIKLSGGQRQRVAIARAILKNAPILILDEATSALDSVTEQYIQAGLHCLMKGRTTIVIAHRLSTLSEMDRLLVFNQGKIIEDGTHTQLLKINGHYSQLWQMQAGGFISDKAAIKRPLLINFSVF